MSLIRGWVFIQCGLLMIAALPLTCFLQKEILLSDVVVCSVAYILTFALTASTVFLSLKVRYNVPFFCPTCSFTFDLCHSLQEVIWLISMYPHDVSFMINQLVSSPM